MKNHCKSAYEALEQRLAEAEQELEERRIATPTMEAVHMLMGKLARAEEEKVESIKELFVDSGVTYNGEILYRKVKK